MMRAGDGSDVDVDASGTGFGFDRVARAIAVILLAKKDVRSKSTHVLKEPKELTDLGKYNWDRGEDG